MTIAPDVYHRLYQNNFESVTSPIPTTSRLSSAMIAKLEKVTEDGNSYVRSTGPWWGDPNHTEPGPGWLHLVSYDYFRGFSAESGVMGGRFQDIDLIGASYTFRVKLDDLVLPEGASLVFWFQAIDPDIAPEQGQFVNYMNVAVRIEELAQPGEWTEITIPLTANEADWVALGPSKTRNATYSVSASIAHALSTAQPVDCGIIIFLGPDYDEANPVTGSVSFDDFRFVAPNSTPDVIYDGLLFDPSSGALRWYDAYGVGGSAFNVAGNVGEGLTPIGNKYFTAGDTQILLRNAGTSEIGYLNIVDGRVVGTYTVLGTVPERWTLQAPTHHSDLDGNGFDDLVWRDDGTGFVTAWMMGSDGVVETRPVAAAGLGFRLIGSGDVTGDGIDDLLWFSEADRLVGYWTIIDGQKVGPFRSLDRRAGQTAIGTGDFNGDGMMDVLWREDASGALSYTAIVNGRGVSRLYLGVPDTDLEVLAIRDISGDGRDDLLFRRIGPDAHVSEGLVNRFGTAVSAEADDSFRVRKTGLDPTKFDSSAISAAGYEGDFRLSVRSVSGVPDFYVGMNSDPTKDNGYQSIDYALQIYQDGRAWLHESGRLIAPFRIDDRVWIWREGSTLRYGTGPDFETASTTGLYRTVTDVNGTLYFDSSFKSPTSEAAIKIEGVASAVPPAPAPPAIRNLVDAVVTKLADGSIHLQKSTDAPASAVASAVSATAYSGDFRLGVEVASYQGLTDFHIGMNPNPLEDNGYRTMDYSVQLWQDGRGYLHQNGRLILTFAIDGQVWIWRDGTTLYYGTGPDFEAATRRVVWKVNGITETLYFDSSFSTPTTDARIILESDAGEEMLYWLVDDDTQIAPVAEGSPLEQGLSGPSDLDGNGYDDVVTRDMVTGLVSVELMDGEGPIGTQPVGLAGLSWNIIGTGDINGDGTDDIAWFSPTEGRAGYWVVKDGFKTGPYRDIVAHKGDQAVGVGDFTGDGSADILWYNEATGRLFYTDVVQGAVEGERVLGLIPPSNEVVGVGDINDDGVDDLLLTNVFSGSLTSWIVDPSAIHSVSVGTTIAGFDFLF